MGATELSLLFLTAFGDVDIAEAEAACGRFMTVMPVGPMGGNRIHNSGGAGKQERGSRAEVCLWEKQAVSDAL
jgi:hypothetical protein